MAVECFDLPEIEKSEEFATDNPGQIVTMGDFEFAVEENELSTKEDILTISEARNCIKDKFVGYHKLLDDKETELLTELESLEETNKPELDHVRSDLVRLRSVVDSFDASLGTNTLRVFLDKQKSLWEGEIEEMERSESLLSHVKLDISDENFVENLIKVNPFLSKAKFRTQLAPLLELDPKLEEDWFLVSEEWFSEFTTSINLTDPQSNDSWEFPVEIPIRTTNCTKQLHSKAWDMLLAFNDLSPGSIPVKRQSYQNETTNNIEVPIHTTKHKCTIGLNDNEENKFNLECEIETFPYQTYEDILKKLSGFYTLFTEYAPFLYTFKPSDTILCDNNYTHYTVSPSTLQRYMSSRSKKAVPVQNTESCVGNTVQLFLIIIPDSKGYRRFRVTCNV